MAVTADELELPLCVFDRLSQLAKWANRKYNQVAKAIRYHNKDVRLNCYYVRVDLTEDTEEETWIDEFNITITIFL